MKHLIEAIEYTNWEMLRKQKYTLVKIHLGLNDPEQTDEAIEGLLNFLDAIQDAVVADNLATEEEVFGVYENE
jgi:hypothetical protein